MVFSDKMDGEDRGIAIMNKMWKRVLKGLLFSVLKGNANPISRMVPERDPVSNVCETFA